jgi:hypothetical protein
MARWFARPQRIESSAAAIPFTRFAAKAGWVFCGFYGSPASLIRWNATSDARSALSTLPIAARVRPEPRLRLKTPAGIGGPSGARSCIAARLPQRPRVGAPGRAAQAQILSRVRHDGLMLGRHVGEHLQTCVRRLHLGDNRALGELCEPVGGQTPLPERIGSTLHRQPPSALQSRARRAISASRPRYFSA